MSPSSRTSKDLKAAAAVSPAAKRGRSKATMQDALSLARSKWLQGDRLDIGQLATELGVSRATLFRWVGSRDALLAEVLWSLFEPTIQMAKAESRGEGVPRIAEVCERVVRDISRFERFRRFVAEDGELALRVLTSRASPVQGRIIATFRELLESEVRRGWTPPLAIDTLAYLLTRLGESFVYATALSGQKVDIGDAGIAVQLLLSGRLPRAPRVPPASKL
ncbi:QsdR family transcriptional regulator [Pseudomarimonas arenosa]|uniref:TetR/AcrR family transcriptional regulator n=1 Tax=Pseudomarimonas arenosa TaxID=2774145 RepID=A0AAW3ZMG7_9GAMM|nr:QsdR family transcriptional regulator [Pseudomarimonas arenosa]MBD8527158.1 TetR/AcrR family transcriptional regulator [Pseudomarimonas arenosa]